MQREAADLGVLQVGHGRRAAAERRLRDAAVVEHARRAGRRREARAGHRQQRVPRVARRDRVVGIDAGIEYAVVVRIVGRGPQHAGDGRRKIAAGDGEHRVGRGAAAGIGDRSRQRFDRRYREAERAHGQQRAGSADRYGGMDIGIVDERQPVLADVGRREREARLPRRDRKIERDRIGRRRIGNRRCADRRIRRRRQHAAAVDARVERHRSVVVVRVDEAIAAVVGPHRDRHRLRAAGDLDRVLGDDEDIVGERDRNAGRRHRRARVGHRDRQRLGVRVRQIEHDVAGVGGEKGVADRAVVVVVRVRHGDVGGGVDAPVAVAGAGRDRDRAGVVGQQVVRRVLGRDRDRVRHAGAGGGRGRRDAEMIERDGLAAEDANVVDIENLVGGIGALDERDPRVGRQVSADIDGEILRRGSLVVGKLLEQCPARATVGRDVNREVVVAFPGAGFVIGEAQRRTGEAAQVGAAMQVRSAERIRRRAVALELHHAARDLDRAAAGQAIVADLDPVAGPVQRTGLTRVAAGGKIVAKVVADSAADDDRVGQHELGAAGAGTGVVAVGHEIEIVGARGRRRGGVESFAEGTRRKVVRVIDAGQRAAHAGDAPAGRTPVVARAATRGRDRQRHRDRSTRRDVRQRSTVDRRRVDVQRRLRVTGEARADKPGRHP